MQVLPHKFSFLLFPALLPFIYLSLPLKVEGYDFEQDSGLGATAEETGHTESGAFSSGSLAGGVGGVINAGLSLLGVLFLLLIIYGGYLWMTGGGNEEQIGRAKKIITSAVTGLIIVGAAYAITAAVGQYFF